MPRKLGWLLVAAVSVVLGVFALQRARDSEQADALSAQAERLLDPPLAQASAPRELRARDARTLAEQAHALSPSARTALLVAHARALELLQRDDPRGARRALAKLPTGAPGIALLRAEIELADSQLSAAERALQPLLAASSSDPRALELGSDVARAQGRADLALSLAERAVSARPSRLSYERRGLAHELAGDLPAARADLERAASLDPKPSAPLLHLGRVLRQQGELSAAVLAFHGAAERNPNDAEAWLSSGICRSLLGDWVGARVDLERAEALAPTRVDPLIALGDLAAAQGNWQDAERRYRAATQLRPEHALAWLRLGNGLMRNGRAADAVHWYRSAIERDPSLAAAHNGLGAALHAQGDGVGARQELELAAKLDPNDPNPLYNLARVHRRNGDEQSAEHALDQAHEREARRR
jgi:tetratricopeptide (TPR) repeat protein